jgi:hypothetical protein
MRHEHLGEAALFRRVIHIQTDASSRQRAFRA